MTRDQVREGARVRDTATGRTGTITSVGSCSLGLVAVHLDGVGYDHSEVWIEYADLERIRCPLEQAT